MTSSITSALPKKTAVFTIVSINYAAFAKTLMQSLAETHPDWDRHVLFVDRHSQIEEIAAGNFQATMVENLALPHMPEFLFRYGIMELNTAVKPYMFSYLRKIGYQHMVYIDPDILVLDRLVDVEQLLNQGATGVLTPHLTAPLEDKRMPSELEIMRAGSFNLGFLALGATPEADQFIAWWERKLEHGAISAPEKGLFTDQKWVDLAPGMFDGFKILRDPGYNAAYWNLAHRTISCCENKWFANERPLRFFHFSGFDPQNPQPFSKHQNRFDLETIGEAKELALHYASLLIANKHVYYRGFPYAFGKFEDGTLIPNSLRVLYREDAEVRFSAGENPFTNANFFLHGEIGELPVIMRAVWIEHRHLQKAFPDPLGQNKAAFYHWFISHGAVEIGIPDAYVIPIRRTLEEAEQQIQQRNKAEAIPLQWRADYKPSIWARALVFLHKRATGGQLGHARLTQYQQVTSLYDFIKLGLTQFRSTRLAARFGIASTSTAKIDPLKLNIPYQTHAAKINFTSKPRQSYSYSGVFFDESSDSHWIGRQARFLVRQQFSGKLAIEVEIYPELFEKVFGGEALQLEIGLNNSDRQTIEVTSKSTLLDLTLDALPEEWPATLYITPSRSFVPKEFNLNDDQRQLSIKLRSIFADQQAIFDGRLSARQDNKKTTSTNEYCGVNVIGYARSEHGVGQSLRQFTKALDRSTVPFTVIDFNANNLSRTQDQSLESKISTDVRYPINVFHINADQMQEAALQLPSHFFARYNIGYWHWELADMLPSHCAGFDNLNEVWVPTAFVQEAVTKLSPIPVVKIPHAIEVPVSSNAHRNYFQLPSNKFLFLVMYDFSSYQQRKNPDAAIAAFTQAFGTDSENVALVIKTQNSHHHAADAAALRHKLAAHNNILWIDRTMGRQEVYDLQAVCDCYVSLHRSEGYGLGPAESMYLGKPVIATNWSGNTEFMHQHNSLLVDYELLEITEDIGVYKAGNYWAEPSIEHATKHMRAIVNDSDLRARIGARAASDMRRFFAPEIIAKRIQERLTYIQNSILNQHSP